MTEWNWVALFRMRRDAEAAGQVITLVPRRVPGFPDGVDCFRDGKWCAWFASLEKPPEITEAEEAAIAAWHEKHGTPRSTTG